MDDTTPNRSAPSGGRTLGSGGVLVAAVLLAAAGLAVQEQDPPTAAPILSTMPAISNADSNNRMIAVTGTDITGTSVLYLIDTIDPHISVYQASGGGKSTQGVRWVGARKIDLDLKVDGFNDKSELLYEDLETEFVQQGVIPPK